MKKFGMQRIHRSRRCMFFIHDRQKREECCRQSGSCGSGKPVNPSHQHAPLGTIIVGLQKFTRFIEQTHQQKIRTKQVKINSLFYRCLSICISFQLLSLFSVDWFLFGTFLFLVCSSIRIIIPTFATEITNKGIEYATSKEADESQRTDPSSDEAVE